MQELKIAERSIEAASVPREARRRRRGWTRLGAAAGAGGRGAGAARGGRGARGAGPGGARAHRAVRAPLRRPGRGPLLQQHVPTYQPTRPPITLIEHF